MQTMWLIALDYAFPRFNRFIHYRPSHQMQPFDFMTVRLSASIFLPGTKQEKENTFSFTNVAFNWMLINAQELQSHRVH